MANKLSWDTALGGTITEISGGSRFQRTVAGSGTYLASAVSELLPVNNKWFVMFSSTTIGVQNYYQLALESVTPVVDMHLEVDTLGMSSTFPGTALNCVGSGTVTQKSFTAVNGGHTADDTSSYICLAVDEDAGTINYYRMGFSDNTKYSWVQLTLADFIGTTLSDLTGLKLGVSSGTINQQAIILDDTIDPPQIVIDDGYTYVSILNTPDSTPTTTPPAKVSKSFKAPLYRPDVSGYEREFTPRQKNLVGRELRKIASTVGSISKITESIGNSVSNTAARTLVTAGNFDGLLSPADQDVQKALATIDAFITDAPATASSTGIAGQIAFDSGFFYQCIATDTWIRVAMATWV